METLESHLNSHLRTPRSTTGSRRPSPRVVLGLILLFALAACAEPDEDVAAPTPDTDEEADEAEEVDDDDDDDDDDDLPVVRIQGLGAGISALVISVFEEEGLDEQHGFRGEYEFIPPDAATQAFLQRETDVSFDSGPPEVALGLGAGIDIVAMSSATRNHAVIIGREDSDAEGMEDLVGSRVGHFSPDSTATMSMTMILDAFHGLDYDGDFDLHLTPPAALVELLEAGEIEATETFHPHRARAETAFGAREIWDPEETWREETGGTLWTTTVAAHRDWIAEDPDTAQNVLDAWCEAADYINNEPDDLIQNERYIEIMGLEDEAMEVFRDYIVERREAGDEFVTCGWTDDQIENLDLFLDMLAERGLAFPENPGGVAQKLEDIIEDIEEEGDDS